MSKKISRILMIVFVLAVVMALAGYALLKDKLTLKNRMDDLIQENYAYTLNYQIDGVESDYGKNSIRGTITGTKGETILYGKIAVEEKDAVDFYMSTEQAKTVWNLKPMFETIKEELKEVPLVGQLISLVPVGDFYISDDQVAEIFGSNRVSLADAGISGDFLKQLEGENRFHLAQAIQRRKDLPESEMLLGEDALYFEIKLEQYGSTILLGIPKDAKEKKLMLIISSGEITWTVQGTYEPAANMTETIPQETLSEDQVALLKKIYEYWKEIHHVESKTDF